MLLQGVELDNYRKRHEIIAYCKKYKIELVIMDSFQRLHRMNHRDSVAMRTLNAMIKEFFAAGVALVMLHHATKGRKGAVEFTGSAEIMTIADNSYFMEKLGKPGSVDFSISPKKMRDIVDGSEPFEIAVMPATVGGVKRLDSLPLEEYKRKYGDQGSVNDAEQAKAKPQYSAVVDVMRKLEAPVSQTKLVELMQYHPRRTGEVKAALQTLMQAYIVEEVEGTRRGLMAYTLNHEAADAEYDTLDTLDARLAAGMYDDQNDEDIISEDALDEDDD